MTREKKYAWMRNKQARKKAAAALKKEQEFAEREAAKAKAALERETAKAKAAAVREAAEAKAALDRDAATAQATGEASVVVVGFTWGKPLPPRTRGQVKRACAWHRRRKNAESSVRCACGECPACRLRARNTKNVRLWRAAKREAV